MKPSRPPRCLIVHALLASLLAMVSLEVARCRSLAGAEEQQEAGGQAPSVQEFQAITKAIGQYKFTRHAEAHMELVKLTPASGNNVTCNDGSPIGYYKRLNSHSKSWIIYLQGGGFCASEESCQFRWQRAPELMSSNFWPSSKIVDGILSSELKDNPYLWNANHIYVPYCSSDSWSGLAFAGGPNSAPDSVLPSGQQQQSGNSFAFMGSKIVERVLESLYEDLPRQSSLHEAKFILLAGGSAGATGVILNLDKVSAFVEQKHSSGEQTNCQLAGCPQSAANTRQPPTVRGLADSGWFLDNEPYDSSKSNDPFTTGNRAQNYETLAGSELQNCDSGRCTPLQSIRQAMRFWNGQVPEPCRAYHPTEPWKCYFGYRAYPSLKTPLFVVQWIYDEAQLLIDNIMRPDTSDQWSYINRLASEVRVSLENVTALFAPSCFSHNLIIKRSWNQININGFKLPHLLNSWEEQSLLENSPIKISTAAITSNEKTNHATNLNLSNNNNQPQATFDALTMRQSNQQQANEATLNMVRLPNAHSRDQPQVRSTQATNTTNRTRTRKRKRNNQQHRQKQSRQKQQAASTTETNQQIGSSPEFVQQQPNLNELVSSNSPMQDLLSLIDRSLISSDILFAATSSRDAIRSSRSTILDDSTLMLTNNVPLEGSLSSSGENQHSSSSGRASKLLWPIGLDSLSADVQAASNRLPPAARFRLIDSCGWPQCNRDCPNPETEFTTI